MLLEYFEDLSAQPPRVLVMHDFGPDDMEVLCGAIEELSVRERGDEVQLDRLPGFVGVDRCSLMAVVGNADLGVEPVSGREREFRCVLSTEAWQQALGLLEPFVAGGANGFQYLAESGSVEWIISTDGRW
jgi:hypothetical protein